MILTATVSVLLPAAFQTCSEFECNVNRPVFRNNTHCEEIAIEDNRPPRTEPNVELYTCPVGTEWMVNDMMLNNKTYNQAATLLFVTGEQAIKHLFSNGTHRQFDVGTLISVLVIYYILACWAAGTSISSGLVVPMLLIGGLYGRIIGQLMVSWFGIFTPEEDPDWAWIDPGAMALIGAASFFGGVSRLTMSLTVIMVEITNDISFLLPIMSAVMISKWVGDFITHPLYHSLLEFKCIPFLDAEPVVYDKKKKLLNLELHTAEDVMVPDVKMLKECEKVSNLCYMLLGTSHGGFPVVKETPSGQIMHGIITRLELCMLLQESHMFLDEPPSPNTTNKPCLNYQKIHVDRLVNSWAKYDKIMKYVETDLEEKYVDLAPYINRSCVTIPKTFSLHRTYIIFRTLGLRHLPIVDEHNRVVGIITRKDLMGYKLEEKLSTIHDV